MLYIAECEALGFTALLTDRTDGDCAPGSASAQQALDAAHGNARTPALVRQVHGTAVVTVDRASAQPWATAPEADGLASADGEVVLGIRVADCVPVYLVSPKTKVFALIHAGRQGTYDGIAPVAVRAMAALGAPLDDIHSHIGPSAGPCCYEVSPELANQFRARGLPAKGRNLDLWGANRRQLVGAGLAASNITCSSVCTICGGRFHSYRRDHGSARNLALLGLK